MLDFLISRFFYALIALLFYASPTLARDCQHQSQILEFSQTLKICPSTSPRSDDISRALLNKVSVAGGASSALMRNPQTRVSTISQPFKVLPSSYSMIYSSEVAVKSPSAGAKSLGFWGHVGEWFDNTAQAIAKDPIQVAWFALGFVPILGGAIDCAKGALALITNNEVDLVDAEMGCIGMSIDAVLLASAQVPEEASVRGIMGTLRLINKASHAVEGAITRALGTLFEKFFSRGIKASVDYLLDLSFLKAVFERSKTTFENFDRLIAKLTKRCLGTRSNSRSIETRASACEELEQGILRGLTSDARKELQKAFVGYSDDEICQIINEFGDMYIERSAKSADEITEQLRRLGKSVQGSSAPSDFWESPIGLKFGNDPDYGNRVKHILERHYNSVNPDFASKSRFHLDYDFAEVMQEIDDIAKRYFEGLPANEVSRKLGDPSTICIAAGYVVSG